MVMEQIKVYFHISKYKNEILRDAIHVDACQSLLEKPTSLIGA
jgi:hypothetical protein